MTILNPRLDLILRQLDGLPALPAVAAGVLKATNDDQPDARAVTRLVESDPAIAARVLQAARRADSGARPVATVERAIVRLGFREVRNLVLALGVVRALEAGGADTTGDHGAFSRGEFWRHSLAVACAAELLAPAAKLDAGEAFCCGLLHDLGKLALHSALPKAYGRVVRAAESLRCDIAEVEKHVIGIDHATAARRLCERWTLPESVRDVAWLHNAPPTAITTEDRAHAPLIHLVTLADQIARRLHLGFSGNYSFGVPRDALLRELSLGPADVSACLEKLVPAVRERGDLLGLNDGDTGRLYRQAIAHADREIRVADKELAEARQQLAAQKRALAAEQQQREAERAALRDQASAFATLEKLAQQLRPDAGVRDVLQAIASTAAATLIKPDAEGRVVPVVAFSHPPGTENPAAEMIVWQGGKVTRHDAVAAAMRVPIADNFPAELRWLPEAASPALDGSDRQWLGLVSEGAVIGGIAWCGEKPAAADIRALAAGWTMALRLAQSRERQRELNEQLAETNRRLGEAREQMARDRALLAVAELAAGAAHEMNNPLMVISGRSQLLYRELTNVRLKQAALAIHHNASRLSEMITQLMRFARPPGGAPEAVAPKLIVDEAVKLLAASLDEADRAGDRRLEVEVAADLPSVRVDLRQWSRAVAAVIENAVQATSAEGGVVKISAARDLSGQSIILTVTDNGAGMDEATLQRAFDPFFSNKSAGRRRGMGLPNALRLVETAGGTLTLDSRESEGTRAVFTIPVVETALRKSA